VVAHRFPSLPVKGITPRVKRDQLVNRTIHWWIEVAIMGQPI